MKRRSMQKTRYTIIFIISVLVRMVKGYKKDTIMVKGGKVRLKVQILLQNYNSASNIPKGNLCFFLQSWIWLALFPNPGHKCFPDRRYQPSIFFSGKKKSFIYFHFPHQQKCDKYLLHPSPITSYLKLEGLALVLSKIVK